MLPRILRELRTLVEEPEPQGDDEGFKAPAEPQKSRCPEGFSFDGKKCVSTAGGGGGDSQNQAAPPPSGRVDGDGEMPHTRPSAKPKDVPMKPDPDSEVMQQPWNRVTYANGMQPHDYAEQEWSEYGGNAYTMAKFPDAFGDASEFVAAYLHAEPRLLDDWSKVEGSDPASQTKEDYDGLINTLWRYKKDQWAQQHGGDEEQGKAAFKEYIDKLIKLAQEENPSTAPPPIIGVHVDQDTGSETRHLLAGNSRALVYAYLGKPCPVREVPLKGRKLQDPSEEELTKILWPAEATEDPNEREAAVRDAVQKVLQARKTGEVLQVPTEMVDVILAFQQALLEARGPGEKKRAYPSGHQKRLFRKIYKQMGYPVGTVRTWNRGKVVKTPKGWQDMPEQPGPANAAHEAPPKVSTSKAAKPEAAPEGGHWIDAIPGFPKDTTHRHYKDFQKPKGYRKRLHQQIIGKFHDHVKDVPKDKKPVAIMLMGGPASGKSSLAKGYPEDQFVRLDADAIKGHIPEYVAATKWRAKNAAKMVHNESVHVMQQLRAKAIGGRKNLIMDGTGRWGDSYHRMIQNLKGKGYHVKVVMADLDKDTAMSRAKKRGAKTGRWVPEHVFDDAYRWVPRNFHHLSKAADEFELWDTRPDGGPELKWEKTGGKETVHDKGFVDEFHKKHTAPPVHPVDHPYASHYTSSAAPTDAPVPIRIRGKKKGHHKATTVHKDIYSPSTHDKPETTHPSFSWLSKILRGEH